MACLWLEWIKGRSTGAVMPAMVGLFGAVLCVVIYMGEREARAEVPQRQVVLMLDVKPPGGEGENVMRGVLLRELGRQAVLVAAREHLEVRTRDDVLREPAPKDVPVIALSVQTTAIAGDRFTLTLAHVDEAGEAETDAFFEQTIELPAEPDAAYATLVVTLERASRECLPHALAEAGLGLVRAPAPPPMAAPMPEAVRAAIARHLERMDELSQYAALRQAHQSLIADGESLEALGVLVRAYANLGQLTYRRWSSAPNAFFARSLLYAQRMVAHAPESAFALHHRAYARTVVGFHREAIEDLKAAREALRSHDEEPGEADGALRMDSAVVAVLEACAWTDLHELYRLTSANEQWDLAAVLWLANHVETLERDAMLDVFESLQPHTSAQLRVLEEMTAAPLVRRQNLAPARVRQIGRQMQRIEATFGELPAAVSEALAELVADASSPEAQAQVARRLVEAGEADGVGEASLAMLGRLFEDALFSALTEWVNAGNYRTGRQDRLMRRFRPLVQDHPLAAAIEVPTISEFREGERLLETIDRLDLTVVPSGMAQFLFFRGSTREVRRSALGQANRTWPDHLDATVNDLVTHLRWLYQAAMPNQTDVAVRQARRLHAMSPDHPLAVLTLAYFDEDQPEAQLEHWLMRHAGHEWISAVFARRYALYHQHEKARPLLEPFLERGEEWAYWQGAATALARDDFDTAERLFRKPHEHLARQRPALPPHLAQQQPDAEVYIPWRVQSELASHAIAHGQPLRAKAYIENLLASRNSRVRERGERQAGRYYEAIGAFDLAEQWMRHQSVRQARDRGYLWYFVRHRTGQGDLDGATRTMEQYDESTVGTRHQIHVMATFRVIQGKPEEALQRVRRFMGNPPNTFRAPETGLLAYLLATEVGNTRWQRASLEALIEYGPRFRSTWLHPYSSSPHPLVDQGIFGRVEWEMVELARRLHALIDADEAAELDLAWVERVLEPLDPQRRVIIKFVVGRHLQLSGREELGQAYLKRCVQVPAITRIQRLLATHYLREQGVDVMRWHPSRAHVALLEEAESIWKLEPDLHLDLPELEAVDEAAAPADHEARPRPDDAAQLGPF